MKHNALICLLLTAATWAVYAQTASFEFVGYDDPDYVTQNPHVQQGLTVEAVRWAFTSSHASNWHPLTWLSHMLDWQLFGAEPAGHHIVNVLIHTLNTLLLFGVLCYMTGRRWPSAVTAALFALHPLHVESVAWIAERKDVLSTAFWLGSMWTYAVYARHGGGLWYAGTAALLALGLTAKPMLVTLPLVLLLLDVWPLERITDAGSATRRFVEKIPLLIIALTSSLVTFFVQRAAGAMADAQRVSLAPRAANAAVSYVRYLFKAVWPVDLAAFYPHPNLPGGQAWAHWQIAAALLLLIAITVWAVAARRSRYALVGWLWYLVTLLPVIGLVQVGRQAMADRYTYVPLIGLFVIVAFGAADLVQRRKTKAAAWRAGVSIIGVIVLAVCAVRAWDQSGYWRKTVTLFEHAHAVTDGNFVAHLNLGKAHRMNGDYDKAIDQYKAALAIDGRSSLAHNNIGVAYGHQGRWDKAAEHFHQALSLDPDNAEARRNLDEMCKRHLAPAPSAP